DKDKQMLMNLSCLVRKDKSKELGEELEKINTMERFSVRIKGTWPPYSFTKTIFMQLKSVHREIDGTNSRYTRHPR
ncbi:hypothetical protein HKBW3S25_02025, partial [Candidatus Hakubella thermalkaliphila]